MATQGTNFSQKASFLRDVFLGMEQEHLDALLTDPEVIDLVNKLRVSSTPERRYQMAQQRIEQIEHGMVNEEDLEKVERDIVILLHSIEDAHMVKAHDKHRNKDNALGM